MVEKEVVVKRVGAFEWREETEREGEREKIRASQVDIVNDEEGNCKDGCQRDAAKIRMNKIREDCFLLEAWRNTVFLSNYLAVCYNSLKL